MNYPGHLIFGVILSSLFILIMNNVYGWFSFSFLNIILYVLIIFLFSLLPDIDLQNSKIVWIFFFIGLVGLVYGVIFDWKILIISIFFLIFVFICTNLPHRGFTHSFLAILLFSTPIYLIFGIQVASLGAISMYSHLLGDSIFFKLW